MILPESFLRCLSPEDRKSLGKAGMSAEDCARKVAIKNERHLQSLIVNLLRLKGIEPLWHRMDKKSAATVGWPDITFTVETYESYDCPVNAICWEVKFGSGQISKEQQQMHIRLSTSPNSWRIKVIRSVDEALAELKKLGL